jgi:hypothetical protein
VADGATLGFSPKAASTVPIRAATVGVSAGAGLSATVLGNGNPVVAPATITNLTLNGTVTISLQATNLALGLAPVVAYTSLSGAGTLAVGTLPTNIVATVTNDTTLKLIELRITSITGAISYKSPTNFVTTASGTNLIFSATNGTPNAPVQLLSSTNINLALSSWTQVYSNILDASGNFKLTNGINTTVPRQFYILQIP